MSDSMFRVVDTNGDVTTFGGGYATAKAIVADLPGAQIQVAEWYEHWPCCAHRIGTCECNGETCCVETMAPLSGASGEAGR